MVYNFLKIYFWIQCAKNCSILPSFFSLPLLCSYIPSLISSYFLFCTVFVFGISFIKWIGNYFHLLFPERDIVELWQWCPQKMWGLEIPLLEVLKIQIQFPWYQFSSVQFSHSVMSDSLQPHESQCARPPCPSHSPSLPKLMCIKSVMPSSHLILYRPLLHLPPIPPSIRVFSNESTLCMRWPKYWSFSLSISRSNEHPRLVSFRVD